MTGWGREVYVLATARREPIDEGRLREAFSDDEVELRFGEEGAWFSVRAGESRVDVHFESRLTPLGWAPELLAGSRELRGLLERARGFYRVRIEPGVPQGPRAVFEGLWTARRLMELLDGVVVDVTAFKLHSEEDVEELTELDFDVRDHVTVHAQKLGEGERSYWVHTHGMGKFATRDVEMFHIASEDLPAAESFFYELCTDLAFGEGPEPRTLVSTSVELPFQLMPAEEARTSLYGLDPETFTGHAGGFSTVVGAEGRHQMTDVLRHYRERFEAEPEEVTASLRDTAERLLPLFKARFLRRGLMEPLVFLVRAPFEVHPEGEEGDSATEQLWTEVVQWNDSSLVGRLVEGGERTTEWRRGSHVEVDDSQVNALAVTRGGRSLEPEELERLLRLERPA